MSDNRPLVYLAGPYSGGDQVRNVHDAVRLADSLLDACVPLVPHLTGLWHAVSPKPYEEWLALDLVYLERCDALYRFGGESSGADAEVGHAEELGIPAFFDESALRAWASAWARPSVLRRVALPRSA